MAEVAWAAPRVSFLGFPFCASFLSDPLAQARLIPELAKVLIPELAKVFKNCCFLADPRFDMFHPQAADPEDETSHLELE